MYSNFKKHLFARAGLISAALCSMPAIYVDIGFEYPKEVSYFISSIDSFNPENSEDLSDLASSGLFQQFLGDNVFVEDDAYVLGFYGSEFASSLVLNSFSNVFPASNTLNETAAQLQNGLFRLRYPPAASGDLTINNALNSVMADFNVDSGLLIKLTDNSALYSENLPEVKEEGFKGTTYELILVCVFVLVGAIMVKRFSN
jgi:hypothetical protein